MHEGPEPEYVDEDPGIADSTTPFQLDCAFCNGTGVHPGTMNSLTHTPCPVCRGKGIRHFHNGRDYYTTCRRCEGSGRQTGRTPPEPCRACHGCGIVESRQV
jgi:DnaJ-class molecular chaperone